MLRFYYFEFWKSVQYIEINIAPDTCFNLTKIKNLVLNLCTHYLSLE